MTGEGISVFIQKIQKEVYALRTAAIGIGSNSLRMLVADIDQGKLNRLKRYREGLRVFAALDEKRNIVPEMLIKASQSVKAFYEEALLQGAQEVCLFATSAVRDAANQETFANALEEATGLKLDVCSGDEEACLSFWGAAESGPTGLIDIGGGSTEIAIGCERRVDDAVSLQMGAVRLFRQKAISCAADALAVADMASELIVPVEARFSANADRAWVGVGGTFTTSAALVQRIPWDQREKIHGFILTQESVHDTLVFLADMPLEERLKLECMQPQRADIVVHGIAILLACMKKMSIPAITVSEYGNLEGYLKQKFLFK